MNIDEVVYYEKFNKINMGSNKKIYPHQNVGLSDVEYGINNATIEVGIVRCTEKDTPYEKMVEMALSGEIKMRYTTLDEDDCLEVI